MNAYWKIETRGDPIGAIQQFVQAVWKESNLNLFLTAGNGEEHPHIMNDPVDFEQMNPFRPVMRENLARSVPDLLNKHPKDRIGILLRPCETRALVEMNKRLPISRDRIITFCVDCLGTYPLDEYEWRTSRSKNHIGIPREPLRFARQGGILAYRYRAACQVCSSPGAQSADLNIHVLGLPVREQILIHTPNHGAKPVVDLAPLTNGTANDELVMQHEHVLARQAGIHQQTMERVMVTLRDLLPKDIDQWILQLENCGDCQNCMAACPVCAVEFPSRDAGGHYSRDEIKRWLISCAGCGMCEQACNANLPLAVIFGAIREKLKEQYHYVPGRDWGNEFPL